MESNEQVVQNQEAQQTTEQAQPAETQPEDLQTRLEELQRQNEELQRQLELLMVNPLPPTVPQQPPQQPTAPSPQPDFANPWAQQAASQVDPNTLWEDPTKLINIAAQQAAQMAIKAIEERQAQQQQQMLAQAIEAERQRIREAYSPEVAEAIEAMATSLAITGRYRTPQQLYRAAESAVKGIRSATLPPNTNAANAAATVAAAQQANAAPAAAEAAPLGTMPEDEVKRLQQAYMKALQDNDTEKLLEIELGTPPEVLAQIKGG